MVSGMKLSVSVPDELWDRVKGMTDDPSPSSVVQAALRSMVADGGRPGYAHTPAVDDELAVALDAATHRLGTEVKQLYADGYRAGVELATQLTWRQLDQICSRGIAAAAEAPVEASSNRVPIPVQLLTQVVTTPDGSAGAGSWRRSPAEIEGIDQALRDVRSSIRTSPPRDGAATGH